MIVSKRDFVAAVIVVMTGDDRNYHHPHNYPYLSNDNYCSFEFVAHWNIACGDIQCYCEREVLVRFQDLKGILKMNMMNMRS